MIDLDIFEEAILLRVRQENGCEGTPICEGDCPCKRAVADAFAQEAGPAQASASGEDA